MRERYIDDATANRLKKLRRLAERPGTPMEGEAARRAIERILEGSRPQIVERPDPFIAWLEFQRRLPKPDGNAPTEWMCPELAARIWPGNLAAQARATGRLDVLLVA
jgi:hypothetical protein